MPLSIPSGSSLVGLSLFHQALVFDPDANILGLTTSNGVELVIGSS